MGMRFMYAAEITWPWLYFLFSDMKYSETSEEQSAACRDYIDKRWRQLNELEIKRSDAVLNYLFLVSGGAAAATLTYIGNLTKDGTTVPNAAFLMLGLFSLSLLLVGLLKASILYHILSIFSSWRQLVTEYYRDNISWDDMLVADEQTVKKSNWRSHVFGWGSFLCIAAGIVVGFVNLQRESSRVRNEKTINTSTESTSAQASPCQGLCAEKRLGQDSGGGPKLSTTSATQEKIIK